MLACIKRSHCESKQLNACTLILTFVLWSVQHQQACSYSDIDTAVAEVGSDVVVNCIAPVGSTPCSGDQTRDTSILWLWKAEVKVRFEQHFFQTN